MCIIYFILFIRAGTYGHSYLLPLNPILGFGLCLFPWEIQRFHFCQHLNPLSNSSNKSMVKHQRVASCSTHQSVWVQPQEGVSTTVDSLCHFFHLSHLVKASAFNSWLCCPALHFQTQCFCLHAHRRRLRSLLSKDFHTKAIYNPQCSLIADDCQLGQLSVAVCGPVGGNTCLRIKGT